MHVVCVFAVFVHIGTIVKTAIIEFQTASLFMCEMCSTFSPLTENMNKSGTLSPKTKEVEQRPRSLGDALVHRPKNELFHAVCVTSSTAAQTTNILMQVYVVHKSFSYKQQCGFVHFRDQKHFKHGRKEAGEF